MSSPKMSSKTLPFIPYGCQWINEDDIAEVVGVLESPYLTTGPKIKEFEESLTSKVKAQEGVAFSSGTGALHGALSAAGIGPGDEVLVPTLTFVATANVVMYMGAKPVFVDCEPQGFNLNVQDALRKMTSSTKAIIPVHFAGKPSSLNQIHDLAKKHKLCVIEDACHALGAQYNNRPIGGLSDMTVFSFHPVKHITTGEGGMVTTNNSEFAARLKSFRNHGFDVDMATREKNQTWYYDMVQLGFNYRMTDIQAALGISQLKKLPQFLKRRSEIAELYFKLLGNNPNLILPEGNTSEYQHAWHLFVVQLAGGYQQKRDEVFQKCRQAGIGVQVHYRPVHLHTFYKKNQHIKADCPVAETLWTQILSLPIYPLMTDGDVRRVTEVLISVLKPN